MAMNSSLQNQLPPALAANTNSFGVHHASKKNGIHELPPERQPFPFGFNFSCPARYHTAGQVFQVGDLCWYEIQCNNSSNLDIHSDYIQWGEAVVAEVLPGNKYRLAGKTWKYDHFTHPLMGLPEGPPQYMNVADIKAGRRICQQWASSKHPSLHVRRSSMNGVDEVMHDSLASVPGEALFKVWDRETVPPCPVPSMRQTEEDEGYKKTYSLEDARKLFGDDLQYKGMGQNELGPEFWGITLEQLMAIKDLPGYRDEMSMYDVVTELLEPKTSGTGMGYALLINQEQPLRAVQMVSHAWEEKFSHFVEALNGSYCSGPFWICATAIYQEDADTIAKQLGPSLEHGPFATVLKQATDMIAVFTPAANIYSRMWCVFEILIAVKYGVNIRFAAFNRQFISGIENIYDAIYEHGRERCNSYDARCSNESDEAQIRDLINEQDGKFDVLDSVVEWCKATYYMNQVAHPGISFKSPPLHTMFLGGPRKLDYVAKTLSSVALAIDRIDDLKFFVEHSVASKDSPRENVPQKDFRTDGNESNGVVGSMQEKLLLDEDESLGETRNGVSNGEVHELPKQTSEVLSPSQVESNPPLSIEESKSLPSSIEVATITSKEEEEGSALHETQSEPPPPPPRTVKQVKFSPMTTSPMTSRTLSRGRKSTRTKRSSSAERMRQLYDQSEVVSARRDEGRKRRSEVESFLEYKRNERFPIQISDERSLSATRTRRIKDKSKSPARREKNISRMRQLYDQSEAALARQEEGRRKRSSVQRTLHDREKVRTGNFLNKHKESNKLSSARKRNAENRRTFKEKIEKPKNKMTIDQARSTYDRLLTHKKKTEARKVVLRKEREARSTQWSRTLGKIPSKQSSSPHPRRTTKKKSRSKNSVSTV